MSSFAFKVGHRAVRVCRTIWLAVSFLAGCGGTPVLPCTASSDCAEAEICLPSRPDASYCSATDPRCPSGLRWAPSAGDGLGGECVSFGADGGSSDPSDLAGSTCTAGSPDPIDDSFFDSNCDGVDGEADKMVFVASDGHDEGACGLRSSPCLTIGYAIDHLATAGRPDIAVSEGEYHERVQLREGISIHGGYSEAHGWARGSQYVARLAGTTIQAGSFVESLYAEAIQSATVDRLTIYTGGHPEVPGLSVYGVRLVNATPTLRHLSVTSGDASAGRGGSNGSDGASGANGDAASGQIHGNGGADRCGSADSAGGNGGNGGWDGIGWACGTGGGGPGQAGTGVCGGGGGGESPSCASGGAAGQRGSDGSCRGGNGGTSQTNAVGAVSGKVWVAAVGGNGSAGGHGAGGAGGGGGGAGDAVVGGNGGNGGGGGGGASGGCAGGGGNGGGGGGASFALLAIGSHPIVVASTFTSGHGGAGGGGGAGGAGGAGGRGGAGAAASGGSGSGISGAGAGGAGGDGGAGGRGGGGQGGPGGPSVGVLLCSSTADGAIAHGGSPGAGGAGGAPNGSPGTNGGHGEIVSACGL
jgi:hypothetical protein